MTPDARTSAPGVAAIAPAALEDLRAFIRAHTRIRPVPLAPELSLHLADESIAIWSQTEEALGAQGLPPPFWAFAWAGGQAIARYLLDTPHEVSAKRVLDFGAGSGLAGLAAARADAAACAASEIDPVAIAAIEENACLNGVSIDAVLGDLVGQDAGWDVVLAADVAYEKGPSSAIFAWLRRLHERGARVLIGDPDRCFLPRDELCVLASYQVAVTRDLEDREIRNARVWTFRD